MKFPGELNPRTLYYLCGFESYEIAAEWNREQAEHCGFIHDFGTPAPDEVQAEE